MSRRAQDRVQSSRVWNAHVRISCMMTGRKNKDRGNGVEHCAIDSVALGFVCFFEGFLRLFQFVWIFLFLFLFLFFPLWEIAVPVDHHVNNRGFVKATKHVASLTGSSSIG